MNKIFLNILAAVAIVAGFASCSSDDVSSESIFSKEAPVRNDFDNWLLENFTYPYNVDVKYRFEDIESDVSYTVTPADSTKSAKLAKLVKYLFYDSYDECVGKDFMKMYSPRQLMFVGSGMYQTSGTVILGYATGSIKIVLTNVNDLTDAVLHNAEELDRLYLSTFHHEFQHILNQKIAFDPSFEEISRPDYVSGNWYQQKDADAYRRGFVRNYAMQEAKEDFAETYSDYVGYSYAKWNNIMKIAAQCRDCAGSGKVGGGNCTTCGGSGEGDGAQRILDKVDFIRRYMKSSYNLDIDELREIVHRRDSEIADLDLGKL